MTILILESENFFFFFFLSQGKFGRGPINQVPSLCMMKNLHSNPHGNKYCVVIIVLDDP